MYTLYVANKNYSSWSMRPWVLMRGLDIPFTERLMVFGQTDFHAFSPSGRVPCLVDGKQTFRDPGHEQQMLNVGTLLQDLRRGA